MKRSPSDKYDHDLATYHHGVNCEEPVVSLYPFEDVVPVIQATAVELVEYLHPDKSIKNNSVEFCVILFQVKNATTCKIESEAEREFVYRLPQYHLPHRSGEQRGVPGSWRSI